MKTCFIFPFLLGGLAAAALADKEPPRAVQDYIAGIEKRILANEDYQDALTGDVLYGGGQKLLFKKPAYDFRTGARTAWLIGYHIGTVTGHSLSDVTMIVLVDKDGTELFKHPDEVRKERLGDGYYTDAMVVKAAKDVYLIGLVDPQARRSPGSASIWNLGEKSKKLIDFQDEAFVKLGSGPPTEQEILFEDIDDDGKTELLVEKRNPQEEKILSRKVYRLDVTKLEFVDDTVRHGDSMAELFTRVKAKKETPRIMQAPPPFEMRK